MKVGTTVPGYRSGDEISISRKLGSSSDVLDHLGVGAATRLPHDLADEELYRDSPFPPDSPPTAFALPSMASRTTPASSASPLIWPRPSSSTILAGSAAGHEHLLEDLLAPRSRDRARLRPARRAPPVAPA